MPEFHKCKSTWRLFKPIQAHLDIGYGSKLLKVSTQVDGTGGEGEVADVHRGGMGKGAYLRLGAVVVRSVPIQFLLCGVGIEECWCTGWWW